jgi:hypothetical protein
MLSLHEIAYAKAAVWQLSTVGLVAVWAFVCRSRLVLAFGSLGVLLGFVVPKPRVYADYRSVEAAYLGAIDAIVEHTVFWTLFGAVLGTLTGLYLTRLRRKRRAAAAQYGTNAAASGMPST